MPLPDFDSTGILPPGLHAAPLAEVLIRFGTGSDARQRQAELLRHVAGATANYPTIKRILVWGSFVTSQPEPNDLDYSIVVSITHKWAQIAAAHRRFLLPFDARLHYGADVGYLAIPDYPLDRYVQLLDFLCHTRTLSSCGIVEISLWGENKEESL